MADISPAAVRSLIVDFFSTINECEVTTIMDVKIKVMLVDDCYSPISGNDILAIVRSNPLPTAPGSAKNQMTDCDDYALHVKDAAARMFRQRCCQGTDRPVPPAVAIVISQNHAVNLFIEQDGQGKNRVRFLDPSMPELPVTDVPAQALRMMKQPPVKLIYM